jgi:hypothetical protein
MEPQNGKKEINSYSLGKEIRYFHGTRRFTAVFTKAKYYGIPLGNSLSYFSAAQDRFKSLPQLQLIHASSSAGAVVKYLKAGSFLTSSDL